MSKEWPLILATCDDGIESPGLRAAVRAVLDLGEVIVSAPCEQQSGDGRSLPSFNDGAIHVIDYSVDHQHVPAYAIHGSPAQAVLYALLGLVPRRPAAGAISPRNVARTMRSPWTGIRWNPTLTSRRFTWIELCP